MRFTDEQWQAIQPYIPPPPSAATRGRPPINERAVLEGIFWKLTKARPWSHLPAGYPSWQTCYRRYHQWRRTGLFDKIQGALMFDLRDRGGIDFPTAVHDGTIDIEAGMRDLHVSLPDALQGTWQLLSILFLLGALRDPFKKGLRAHGRYPLYLEFY
ncbi:MAG: transposase [Anaerolineales bacterium]|jgi:transposase